MKRNIVLDPNGSNQEIPKFSVYYQNTRGIRSKLSDIYCEVLGENFCALAFTETWLSPDIHSSEILDTRYNVFRNDRNAQNSSKSRGGGVLLAINNKYKCSQVSSEDSVTEQVWVKVSIPSRSLIIGCIYLPPKSAVETYNAHMLSVQSICDLNPNCDIVVVGDFNLPNIVWTHEPDFDGLLPTNITNECEICVCDNYFNLCFNQLNNIENANGKILDLCFCNCSGIELVKCAAISKLDVYHPCFVVYLDSYQDNLLYNSIDSFYNFKRANYEEIGRFLSNISWLEIFSSASNVNEALDSLYSFLYQAIVLFVPVSYKFKSTYPAWFNSRSISLVKMKKAAHKQYKASKSGADYLKFDKLRSQCKESIKASYTSYLNNLETDLKRHPKKFWKFIRTKTRTSLPPQMKYRESILTSETDISNAFMDYFYSVYDDSKFVKSHLKSDISVDLSIITIHACEIDLALRNLDVSKGCGPDGVPPVLLKNCKDSLVLPLHVLFNMSLSSGIFPAAWTHAYLVPIFKSGSITEIVNYRPISILSSVSKVFERVVCSKVTPLLRNVLVEEQHGFFQRRSTITNLIGYVNFIINAIGKGSEVHAIYTDFSKAFDKVNHYILIQKLQAYGIAGNLLEWFKSYLSERTQQVKIGSCYSRVQTVPSGVPQGSVIGPILFSVFINDIGYNFRCNFRLFADDLKIYNVIHSDRDVQALQSDIDALHKWCTLNTMSLNSDKCFAINFSRKLSSSIPKYMLNNINLALKPVVKDLGILLDNKLSFRSHYDFIVNKANRSLGAVKRHCRGFRNIATLSTLYVSNVRSILEYGCLIWSPYYRTHEGRIESVQIKFINFIKSRLPSFVRQDIALCRDYLGFSLLKRRREFFALCFMYKLFNNLIDSQDILGNIQLYVPQYPTRNMPVFKIASAKTNYALNCPLNAICHACNKYGDKLDFFSGKSYASFKFQARRLIINSN